MTSLARVGLLLALGLVAAPASAQATYDGAPPHERLTMTHTYVEGRLGAIGNSPLGTRDGDPMRVGGALEGSAGIAFRWLDLGLTARYGSLAGDGSRLSYVGFGPEVALRKSLGDGVTLRLGAVPMYAIIWDAQGASRRIGADALAQVLFTVDNVSRPAWRAGFGFRAGRYATTDAREPGWSVGVDLLARSWW